MYEPQHFVDLQDNPNFGDPKSWLSAGDGISSPTHHRAQSQLNPHAASGASGNLDRVLINEIAEMMPLVQSLIDQKVSSSFTRRGSMIYTKTPSRESLRKVIDPKGRNGVQSFPGKKKRDHGEKDQGKHDGNQDADGFSIFSSRALGTEKETEELISLRGQVEDLQRELSEKDELLKSAELAKNEVNVVHTKFDELKLQAAEKDSLIKSTQQQLSDAKIMLADRQAALEKLKWEAMTSQKKAEKLQEELDSVQGDISSLVLLFEGLTKNDPNKCSEDYEVKPCYMDYLPDIDDLDETEMQKMEEARQAYIVAVSAAKGKQDEESIAAAASARRHLQSFVLKASNINDANA